MTDEEQRHVLVLDELIERFRILAADSDEERDAVLAALDAPGERERTMLRSSPTADRLPIQSGSSTRTVSSCVRWRLWSAMATARPSSNG